MFAAGLKIAGRTVAATNQQSVRNVVCGMPRNRVSFTEKTIHGIIIFVGCMIIPGYIAVNIKHYRPKEEE